MVNRTDAAALSICAFLLGVWIGVVAFFETPSVNCPQEDSCYADYYEGAWHIIPGERP